MSMGLTVIIGLLGGIGIFFLGMQLLADGLQKAAGERMRRILELFTSRPSTAILTGAVTTAILQSSSTVTVMIIGFVNSGLMTLSQAIGTIMGANIGTTITAQIVSFDIYALAFPFIGVGALLYFFTQKRIYKYVGKGILGFGLLLLGLSTMSQAVDPIKGYQPFLDLLVTLGNRPILGILAGTLFTAVVQSSSATTGLVIAFSLQGVLSLPAGLAIIVGANVGTCLTVVLASLNASITAKRAAMGHVLFNFLGVVLFIIFRTPFINLVLTTGGTVARQVANAHTLFNVITTVIAFPFITHFVNLVTKIVPGDDTVIELKPTYLDDRMAENPGALLGAQKEAVRMGTLAVDMVEQAVSAFLQGDSSLLHQIDHREEVVNMLEKAITAYLAKANQHSMEVGEARRVMNLMHIVNDLERIGDHAINIAELAEVRIDSELELSENAATEVQTMHEEVIKICRSAIEAIAQDDGEMAKGLIARDDIVDEMEKRFRANHIERLNQDLCDTEIGVLFLDAVSNLERVADHATNIAESVADVAFAK